MVTAENRVKILDFGLAKLAPTLIEEHETLSRGLSQSGVTRHCTLHDPEQASGKTIDFRSDQFSFGLILYEMATGKRAFQQETPAQVLGYHHRRATCNFHTTTPGYCSATMDDRTMHDQRVALQIRFHR